MKPRNSDAAAYLKVKAQVHRDKNDHSVACGPILATKTSSTKRWRGWGKGIMPAFPLTSWMCNAQSLSSSTQQADLRFSEITHNCKLLFHATSDKVGNKILAGRQQKGTQQFAQGSIISPLRQASFPCAQALITQCTAPSGHLDFCPLTHAGRDLQGMERGTTDVHAILKAFVFHYL